MKKPMKPAYMKPQAHIPSSQLMERGFISSADPVTVPPEETALTVPSASHQTVLQAGVSSLNRVQANVPLTPSLSPAWHWHNWNQEQIRPFGVKEWDTAGRGRDRDMGLAGRRIPTECLLLSAGPSRQPVHGSAWCDCRHPAQQTGMFLTWKCFCRVCLEIQDGLRRRHVLFWAVLRF